MTGDLLVLRSGGASASFAPGRGAGLESLVVDGRELLGGIAPIPGYPASFYSGCFLMAPFTGALTAGGILGAPRPVTSHAQGGVAHGTIFDAVWTIVTSTLDRAHLTAPLGERWPFEGSADLEVELSGDQLTMSLSVRATERMPVALGFHPWFRRTLGTAPAELSLRPEGAHEFDAHGMATSAVGQVPPRPWDHVLTGVAADPVIRWPELTLTLQSPTHTWVVYEHHDQAFCIEPVTAPAGVIADGGEPVEAGASRELPFTLRWSR